MFGKNIQGCIQKLIDTFNFNWRLNGEREKMVDVCNVQNSFEPSWNAQR